ncbi:hypothetical protein [Lapidilactobacillus bayanensis]|uniref:hypothetical protein n=1 Tax=Lapidilactobacillus bayanensis TaxID=2485998 RepID=UPI000F7B5D8E|nr:hypothetical protein [Lapidilactobacillus bayanensis]
MSPNSVANFIALLASIPALVASVVASGVSWTAFSTGVKTLVANKEIAGLLPKRPSLNGYYSFSQETRKYQSRYQARNTNRKLVFRVNKGAYSTKNYGAGAWFDMTRP